MVLPASFPWVIPLYGFSPFIYCCFYCWSLLACIAFSRPLAEIPRRDEIVRPGCCYEPKVEVNFVAMLTFTLT